jgi:hypothetical protein
MSFQDNRDGLISRKGGIFRHSVPLALAGSWLVKSAPIAYIPGLFLKE